MSVETTAKPRTKRGCGARRHGAQRHLHAAVQATTTLKQEAAVPVARQREREADAVRLAVGTGPSIEHAIDAAVRRQLHALTARLRARPEELSLPETIRPL